jgi:tetratricopeptide (TPR) repeat protein
MPLYSPGHSHARRPARPCALPILISVVALLAVVCSGTTYAQKSPHSRTEDSLLYIAVSKIDEGDLDGARQMLRDGAKRFPENSTFVYEQCYILAAEKKYDECRKLLLTIIDAPDADGTYPQLLGNMLDYLGEPEAAIETYEKGLKRFPDSGPLYLERGIMSAMKENIGEAMGFWEEGIRRDPSFSSNYFHVSRIWMQTESPGWGLIYGEIFLNLEPKGERADMIRRALFATWDKAISTTNGKPKEPLKEGEEWTGGVDLFKNELAITVDDNGTALMPFEFFYSATIMFGAVPYLDGKPKEMTIADLTAIRSRFVDKWFENAAVSKHFAIDLFEHHKALKAAGLLEAYDYLLFRSEDTEKEFEKWEAKNSAKMFEAMHWMIDNKIAVEPGAAFSRIALKGIDIHGMDKNGEGDGSGK